MPDNNGKKSRFPGFDFGGNSGRTPSDPNSRRRVSLLYAVPIILIAYLLFVSIGSAARGASIPYSVFISKVQSGQVKSANISTDSVTGVYNDAGSDVRFTSTLPPNFDTSTLTTLLTQHKVEVTATQPNPWVGFIGNILLFGLLLGGFYYFMFRRMGGAGAGPLS